METQHTAAPAARSSGALTAGIGIAVAVVGLVFALNSIYGDWYALFRLVHVVLAVFWVGGGLTVTLLALWAERKQAPDEMALIARQAAFVGERFFAPAGLVVLLMGIAMMINTDWGWGKFWVIAGLIGYAATFVTGLAFLGPESKRISALLAEKGAAAPETQAAIGRILAIARVDTGVLLLVVADMVTKPFS
jgi:uncharacterized membrane protein